MDTLTFTSVILKNFCRTPKGGVAMFSSSLNDKICKAMGWGIGAGQTSAHLEGELHASSMSLKPAEQALAKHKLEMDIQSVKDFEAIRYELEGKKGKGFRHEIHFKIHFGGKDACRDFERYMLTIGEGKATLQVSYVKQQELAGDDGQPMQSQEDEEDAD